MSIWKRLFSRKSAQSEAAGRPADLYRRVTSEPVPAAVVGSELNATMEQQRGKSGDLGKYAQVGAPADWTSWSDDGRLCTLWYPSDWRFIDTRDRVVLRPTFSEDLWESSSTLVYNPAMSLIVGLPRSYQHAKEYFDGCVQTLSQVLADENFRLICNQVLQIRGRPARFFRYLFDRDGRRWEAMMNVQVSENRTWLLDASGTMEQIDKHRSVLMKVLANLRVYESVVQFDVAAPR